jgi:type I restriction enzyme S subunit
LPTFSAADELAKYHVQEGDLLITEGGDWDKVGRTAIWRGGVENCVHQNHVFKARVPSALLLKEWVELVFNSGVGRYYFAGASKQTTNLASINMTQLRSFPLPIPPEDEQQRILTILSELTARCNEWRHQLERKQELSVLHANAIIATLTGITLEEQESSPMKSPQTELISPLRLAIPPDVKAQAPLATILARHSGEMSARDLWQRFGGEIDAFYAQLKIEVAHGWIAEPEVAEMREKTTEATEA